MLVYDSLQSRTQTLLQRMLYYIHQTPFPLRVLKGGLGTRLRDSLLSCALAWTVNNWPLVGELG